MLACMQRYDSIIVGAGPAGLTAAIYLARFNRSVMVIDSGYGRSTSHETNENYLGFPDGVEAKQLRELGRRQAERFGAEFAEGYVREVMCERSEFHVGGDEAGYVARTLILATGVLDTFPEIAHVEEYVGRSLFWCIVCDGYKTRGRRIVVVGNDDEAAVSALQFLAFTPHVTLITNKAPGSGSISRLRHEALAEHGIALVEGAIKNVDGEGGYMRSVTACDAPPVRAEMMFSHQGARPNSELAQQLGVRTGEHGYILVDSEQRTSVERCYAAGDVTRIFAHQIVSAAHEGATAGITANYELYEPWQQIE
jgi:thioredoxin reductase (NADPH)